MITRIAGFRAPRARILVRVAGWMGLPPRLAMLWSDNPEQLRQELRRLKRIEEPAELGGGLPMTRGKPPRALAPELESEFDEYKRKLQERLRELEGASDDETQDMPAVEEDLTTLDVPGIPTLQRQLQKEGLPSGAREASEEMKAQGYDYEGTTLVGDVVGLWRPGDDSPWMVDMPDDSVADVGVLKD